MTDAQWRVLEPDARQVMDEIRRAAGRPMVHDLRAMMDAIGYVVRNGIEWRALPADFPPWEAVYAFFQRWSQRGLPQRLVQRLRGRLRTGLGRDVQPSAAILDSQTVKAADTVGAGTRGFDSGNYVGNTVMPTPPRKRWSPRLPTQQGRHSRRPASQNHAGPVVHAHQQAEAARRMDTLLRNGISRRGRCTASRQLYVRSASTLPACPLIMPTSPGPLRCATWDTADGSA